MDQEPRFVFSKWNYIERVKRFAPALLTMTLRQFAFEFHVL